MNANAIINIARAQLGLEEDDYRALLGRVTGETSLRAMSARQKSDVLDEMKRLGFRARPPRRGLPLADKPYQRLIHALWAGCARTGAIENGSRAALRAFCGRFVAHGSDSVAVDPDMLSYEQASPIIEALKKMQARGGKGSGQ